MGSNKALLLSLQTWFCGPALTAVLQTINEAATSATSGGIIVSILCKTQYRGKLSVTDPSPCSDLFSHSKQLQETE